jgi:hypothetical protein
MKKRWGLKAVGYSLLLTVGLAVAIPNTNPQTNVLNLVATAEESPSQKIFRGTTATLILQEWGYVMVVCVKDKPSFSPYQFLIVSKVKGQACIVEGISGPGPENASRLSPANSLKMIDKLGVPLKRLDLL